MNASRCFFVDTKSLVLLLRRRSSQLNSSMCVFACVRSPSPRRHPSLLLLSPSLPPHLPSFSPSSPFPRPHLRASIESLFLSQPSSSSSFRQYPFQRRKKEGKKHTPCSLPLELPEFAQEGVGVMDVGGSEDNARLTGLVHLCHARRLFKRRPTDHKYDHILGLRRGGRERGRGRKGR